MQPPGDYLLDPKLSHARIEKMIVPVILVAGIATVVAGILNRAEEGQENLAVRSSCGSLQSISDMENLPPATKKEQVEELGKTIEFLKDKKKCRGGTEKAVERLEKLKAKWERALPKNAPVSDLRWMPKNRAIRMANPQNMLPKRIMRG